MPRFIVLIFTVVILFANGCGNPKETAEKNAVSENGNSESAEATESSTTSANHSTSETNSESPNLKGPVSKPDPEISASSSTGDIRFSLKFLSWNVESEGSDPATIAKELTELGKYDLIALTEVLPHAATDFCVACGEDFNYLMSETGRNDRMMLIYNRKALQFVRQFEIHDINYKSRYRSPLVGHFKDVLTGKELLVMVNHLARGSEKTRQIQAEKLVKWARDQSMPIVALGDYNFDFVFETRKGNEAFRLFMKDHVFDWVEPIELIDTNWYDNPQEPDGKDDYPGSMLDFAFVAGPAKDWTTSCKIIVRDGDFPDDEMTSDHRPFEVIVSGK